MKKAALIFFLALSLNILWENAHSILYSSYGGGHITEFILVRASLFDAVLISIILSLFAYISSLRSRTWMIFTIGICIAIVNEWYGLGTGRWTYGELMPVIPILETGITPTLQLGVLGYVTWKIQEYVVLHCVVVQK